MIKQSLKKTLTQIVIVFCTATTKFTVLTVHQNYRGEGEGEGTQSYDALHSYSSEFSLKHKELSALFTKTQRGNGIKLIVYNLARLFLHVSTVLVPSPSFLPPSIPFPPLPSGLSCA